MENIGENGSVLHEDQTNSIHTMNERHLVAVALGDDLN